MADVVVAAVRVSASTSDGTQDITTSALGGRTPKAVLFMWNYAIGDGASDDAGWGWGAASGATERWAVFGCSEHGVASTDNSLSIHNDRCINFLSPGTTTVIGEADIDSFITNGVRIDWVDAPPSGFQILAIFFAGDDVQAHADTHEAQDGLNITAPGFQPNLIFAAASNTTPNEASSGLDSIGFGWQEGVSPFDAQSQGIGEDNNASDGSPASRRSDGEAVVVIQDKSGAIDYACHYDTFDSSGMSAVVDNDDDDHVAYLALQLADTGVKVAAFTTPISSGDFSVTGVGFTPQAVFLGMNTMFNLDTGTTGATAGSQGFSVFTEDVEETLSAQIEDGSATTDTQSFAENEAATLPFHNGGAYFAGTFSSMDSDGFTLNYSLAPAPLGSRWFYLAIEASEAPDAQGQVSFAELETPDIAGQGQVSFAELETPDVAGRGQTSFAELETPDVAGQGQVSFAELETPDIAGQGQVSWAELETPDEPAQGQVSWAELQVPDETINARSQVSFAELETPDVGAPGPANVGFAQLQVPDPENDPVALVSFAELKVPDVNTGGTEGSGEISFAELEVPDAEAIQVSRLYLELPETKRRGRISWARVEFASPVGTNRQEKIALKDINRRLFLEELDEYGVKPDVGFFLPGFDPVQGGSDPQRIWTPKTQITTQFGETVQRGEMWLEYSYILTNEDLFHIQLVCNRHDSTRTTEQQDIDDEFFDDLTVLKDYASRCYTLTPAEQQDCHCRLLRFVLRLATETTVRRIQEDPFTDEPFD